MNKRIWKQIIGKGAIHIGTLPDLVLEVERPPHDTSSCRLARFKSYKYQMMFLINRTPRLFKLILVLLALVEVNRIVQQPLKLQTLLKIKMTKAKNILDRNRENRRGPSTGWTRPYSIRENRRDPSPFTSFISSIRSSDLFKS